MGGPDADTTSNVHWATEKTKMDEVFNIYSPVLSLAATSLATPKIDKSYIFLIL